VLREQQAAAQKMIDLYQQQRQTAERRTENLRRQREQIKQGAH
jgi:hypothetical protein